MSVPVCAEVVFLAVISGKMILLLVSRLTVDCVGRAKGPSLRQQAEPECQQEDEAAEEESDPMGLRKSGKDTTGRNTCMSHDLIRVRAAVEVMWMVLFVCLFCLLWTLNENSWDQSGSS